MRPSSIPIFRHAAAVVVALCAAASLVATTLERLSMNDLADQCMLVVRGTVTSGAGELNNGIVSTHYRLSVSEVWKGTAGSQVDIYVPGGSAQGFLQSVPGAPTLTPGADYVLFLWIGPSGRPQIIGLSQGLFTVVKTKNGAVYLNRGSVSEMMVDSKTGRPVTSQPVHMPASELKAFVQSRANQVVSAK